MLLSLPPADEPRESPAPLDTAVGATDARASVGVLGDEVADVQAVSSAAVLTATRPMKSRRGRDRAARAATPIGLCDRRTVSIDWDMGSLLESGPSDSAGCVCTLRCPTFAGLAPHLRGPAGPSPTGRQASSRAFPLPCGGAVRMPLALGRFKHDDLRGSALQGARSSLLSRETDMCMPRRRSPVGSASRSWSGTRR